MKNEQEFRKDKKPWPTKAAMEQVYDQHLWGGKEHDFYSGFGAHNPELVEPYIEVVKKFLDSFETPLTVCDLGCGDFNVGKELVDHSLKYIAIDIAENVIERNRKKFSDEKLEFQCWPFCKSRQIPTSVNQVDFSLRTGQRPEVGIPSFQEA